MKRTINIDWNCELPPVKSSLKPERYSLRITDADGSWEQYTAEAGSDKWIMTRVNYAQARYDRLNAKLAKQRAKKRTKNV